MKLLHFRGPNGERNFGDELGPWLWDRLLPGAFDDDGDRLFIGIGTLLNNRLPVASRIVIFGSGVGYGEAPPTPDSSWSIYCLRGPLSAAVLGVATTLAITDPGALVRRFVPAAEVSQATWRFSYMPHWRYACDDWERVCERLGFGYIDPRRDVDEVIEKIRRTQVLIAEAMHGAIVADALRVPWIPVQSTPAILDFKWRDWCASLDLKYRPWRIVAALPVSTHPTAARRAKHKARLAVAAARLLAVSRLARPALSDEAVLDNRLESLERALQRLRRDLATRVQALVLAQ
jgi:succinoglycan biosynthesis protein ExoV